MQEGKLSNLYEERSVVNDTYTVVMRSAKLSVQFKLMDYWTYNPSARWMVKRGLLRLAYGIMRKWGKQYSIPIETKTLMALKGDETVSVKLMTQVREYAQNRGLYPEDLVYFIGDGDRSKLIYEHGLRLPDVDAELAVPKMIVSWRNIKGIVIPNMEGVIVLPKTAAIAALDFNKDIKCTKTIDRF